VAALVVNDVIQVPEDEFEWTFVRAGGPGGQNVNKVASKAVLRWSLRANRTVPDEVKRRFRSQQHRRINAEGELILSCQRFRDQARNIDECLDKLREMLLAAAVVPKLRRATRPTRSSKLRRLQEKRRRTGVKQSRRRPVEE
jgi:ribosome-associated protein